MWSLTFPYASYTLAWIVLSKDLRDHGMAGFAAANTVVAAVIWLFCAGMTVWKALLTGAMFIVDQPKDKTGAEPTGEGGVVAEDRDVDCMNGWSDRGASDSTTQEEKDMVEPA